MLMKHVFKLELEILFSVIFVHPVLLPEWQSAFHQQRHSWPSKKAKKQTNPKPKKTHKNKQTKNVLQAYTDS